MEITDFTEQLKEGQKIRRSRWRTDAYIQEELGSLFKQVKGERYPANLTIEDIEADDWELYIEKEERQLNLLHMIMEEYRSKPELGFEYYDVQLQSVLNKE